MARSFDGSTQFIRTSPGAFASTTFTYGMVAVFARPQTTDGMQMIAPNAGSGFPDLSLGFTGGGAFDCWVAGANASSTTTITGNTGWYLFVLTKATGSVAPRFHWYSVTNGTWNHENAGGSLGNGGQTITVFDIGQWGDNSDDYNGDMAAAGVFRTLVPTDAELEAMGLHLSRTAWLAAAARADRATVWWLDQAATSTPLLDLTGGGANESSATAPGIAAATVPLLGYGGTLLPAVQPPTPPPDTDWLNPASDTTINSWTTDSGGTSDLYQSIDEDDPPNDSDYIRSPEGATSGSYYETALEVATGDAGLSTFHTVSYRYRTSATSLSDLTVSLREGAGTEIASWAETDISSSWTTRDRLLSGAEADAIDYPTDLRIRFAPTAETETPALVADRGSLGGALSGATSHAVDMAAAGSITVGNYLIARVAVDNTGTNGARPGLTVTDTRSNTWSVGTGGLQDPGAASAGTACYIAYAKVANAYTNGDDITFTWGTGSPAAKAIVIEEWSGIHPSSPIAAAETNTGTSGTAFSLASNAATAVGQLVYGVLSVEGPTGDTAPSDADVTALTRVSTTDGTAASNQTVNGAYRISTAAAATTWNATITSRDWAAAIVVFAPAPTRVHVSWAGMTIPAGTAPVTGVAATDIAFAAPAIGTRTVFGTIADTIVVSNTAVGTKEVFGTAATDVAFTSPVVGTRVVGGTVDTTLTFSAMAAGAPERLGTAEATFAFATTADGTVTAEEVFGTAVTTVTFSSPAVGIRETFGTTSDAIVFSAPATGTTEAEEIFGTAETTIVFSTTAVGVEIHSGTADATLTFSAPVTGTRTVFGTAADAIVFSAPAVGTVTPIVTGTADTTLTFAAPAQGTRVVTGSASDAITFATSATGTNTVSGAAATTIAFDAPASGTSFAPGTGVAEAVFTFAAPAIGTRTVSGTAADAIVFTAPATGTRVVLGTSSTDIVFATTAGGTQVISGTADATLTYTAPATGTRVVSGTAADTVAFTAPAAGGVTKLGTAADTVTFTAPATGSVTVTGVAVAEFTFVGPATGATETSGTATTTITFATDADGTLGVKQYFRYADFLEYVRSYVETTTGRPCFLSFVDTATAPAAPYSVIHTFGNTGALTRTWDGQAVTLSFYLQVDGVGRKYHDAIWVLDKAIHAIRRLPAPDYVNDMLIHARSSTFEIRSEALRAVGRRMGVTVTRPGD